MITLIYYDYVYITLEHKKYKLNLGITSDNLIYMKINIDEDDFYENILEKNIFETTNIGIKQYYDKIYIAVLNQYYYYKFNKEKDILYLNIQYIISYLNIYYPLNGIEINIELNRKNNLNKIKIINENVINKIDMINKIYKIDLFLNTKINLSLKGINDEILKNLSEIEMNYLYLNLRDNDICSLKYFNSDNFKNLIVLILNFNNIINLNDLENNKLSNLKRLYIMYNKIEDIKGIKFLNLKKLELLNLSHNFIIDISPFKNLYTENLKEIYLRHNKITNFTNIFNFDNSLIEKLDLAYIK